MDLDTIPVCTKLEFSEDEWSELNSKYDNESIRHWIIKIIRKNNIPFPQTEYTVDFIRNEFKRLQDYDTKKIISNTKYSFKHDIGKKWDKSIGVLWGMGSTGNHSSNYFHERIRFNVSRVGRQRPNHVWATDDRLFLLLKSLWTLKFKSIGMQELKAMFRLGMYQAGQFKTPVAKGIYEYFEAENVSDMSMGWGDRLAGFNAVDCTKYYFGTDPNSMNFKNYLTQHKFYGTGKEIDLHSLPAEDINIKPKYPIDLSFTSPPYFAKEQYVDEDTQSYVRYETLDSWLSDFLFKAIKIQWDFIKHGGHFVINVSDVLINGEWQKICDPMNDFISSLNDSEYLGHMGMKISKRPAIKLRKEIEGSLAEPIWVWKKH